MIPELICVVKNGVAFMGKEKDFQQDDRGTYLWVMIDNPYMLVAQQTGPKSMSIKLQEIVGNPKEITIYTPEVTYKPTAEMMIREYLKSATGIVIAHSLPGEKQQS